MREKSTSLKIVKSAGFAKAVDAHDERGARRKGLADFKRACAENAVPYDARAADKAVRIAVRGIKDADWMIGDSWVVDLRASDLGQIPPPRSRS